MVTLLTLFTYYLIVMSTPPWHHSRGWGKVTFNHPLSPISTPNPGNNPYLDLEHPRHFVWTFPKPSTQVRTLSSWTLSLALISLQGEGGRWQHPVVTHSLLGNRHSRCKSSQISFHFHQNSNLHLSPITKMLSRSGSKKSTTSAKDNPVKYLWEQYFVVVDRKIQLLMTALQTGIAHSRSALTRVMEDPHPAATRASASAVFVATCNRNYPRNYTSWSNPKITWSVATKQPVKNASPSPLNSLIGVSRLVTMLSPTFPTKSAYS